VRRLHWHHHPIADRHSHLQHPAELIGGSVMLVAALTTVTVAIADASAVGSRLRGGADPDRPMWLVSFAVALATLLLGALAHTGHPAGRTSLARAGYGVAAALNVAVLLAVTVPAEAPAALPMQQLLAAALLVWLTVATRPAP
jgi:hypothetical protein